MLAVSLAFARLVVEPNTPQPMLEEDAVMVVQRHGVDLGCGTDPGDAGVPDAATGDAGILDAGVPDAGTCEPIRGDAITMTVRPRFATDPMGARFALLFVTPSRPIVETTEDTFVQLAQISAPRTEVIEHEVPTRSLGTRCSSGCGGGDTQSSSGGGCEYDGSYYEPPPVGDAHLGDGGAVVETVGPYEVVRVQPADTAALATLLDSFHYQYQQADLDAVAPYIARGYTVVAVRMAIDSHALKAIPLAMTWAGTELKLPVGLGDASPENLQIYLIADGRYEFADAIVRFAGFTFGATGGFLTVNRLAPTISTGPDEDPVAHHVLGDEEYQEVNVINRDVPVPVEDCSGEEDSGGCCRECNARGSVRPDWAAIGLVVAVLLRPRRRRRTTSSR